MFVYRVFTLVLFLPAFVFAQTEALSTREIKLNAESIKSTAFPFEEPFNLVGDAPENCFEIWFSFQLNEPVKPWMTFYGSGAAPVTWKKDGSKFALLCAGMHPNIKYSFDFRIFRNSTLDDKQKNELKKKIYDRLVAFSLKVTQSVITQTNKDALNKDLNAILTSTVSAANNGRTLMQKSDLTKKYILDVGTSGTTIGDEYDKIITKADAINTSKDLLFGKPPTNGFLDDLGDKLIQERGSFLDDINKIVAGKMNLSPMSEAFLKLSVSPSVPAFSKHTLMDGLKILQSIFANDALLRHFLAANQKIVNTELQEYASIDFPTFNYFHALLYALANGAIVDDNGSSKFSSLKDLFGDAPKLMGSIRDQLANIETKQAELAELLQSFPDFSAEVVTSEALSVETLPVPDVVSEKSPYISAEAGVGYSTSFQSALSYYGANFYLAPVNKKTPLSRLSGWNLFKKMFCLSVAIGNNFGSRPLNSYSILGQDSKNDLMLGAGVRLGRIIKLTAMWSLYKTDNKNVLAPSKDLKSDFVITAGADVNLLKALGDIGKTLNLIK